MTEPERLDPEEQQLAALMHALDPSPQAEQRMEAALMRALVGASPDVAPLDLLDTQPDQSLTAEWIELLRLRPAANSALVLAAAVVLYFTTPLGALAGLIGR